MHGFPHYKSMGAFCCHGNQSFDPIWPKTLCSLSPTPVMLHIKFDQVWPTGFRDIQVWKCGRRRTDDGPLVYYKLTLWAFGWGELKMHCFTFFPYKSIRDQIWPCILKIGQGQSRVIVCINLVLLEHPMLHTKFRGHQPFGSGDVLWFLPYMDMAAILVRSPIPESSIWNLTDWPSGFRGVV